MAKETKKTKSATKHSGAMTRVGGANITTAQARAVLQAKGKGGGKSRKSSGGSTKELEGFAIGGGITGAADHYLNKPDAAGKKPIDFVPAALSEILGAGTAPAVIAVAAHYAAKGKGGTFMSIRNAAAAIAAAELAKKHMPA
jgi:hypothetical protein